MDGNSYLEWKTIHSEDETTIAEDSRSRIKGRGRAIRESKSLPLSSQITELPLTTSVSESNVLKNIQIDNNNATFSDKCVERECFVSNTINRYSRFRAKQKKQMERGEKKIERGYPKKTEAIYANLKSPFDKKTLVQRWIETSQNDDSLIKSDETESPEKVKKLEKLKEHKINFESITLPKSLLQSEDDVPLELRCPVCLDLYQKPLFLPCGHTFCKGCIQKVVDSGDPEAKRKQRFVCPTCRNIIKYGDEGIIGLPKNTSLEHLVKRYSSGHKIQNPICQRHQKSGKEKNIWCFDCSECVCTMCQLEKHNGHDTAPVNVVSQFQTVRRKLKKTKMILDSKVDDLKLSLNEMNKNKIEMEDKSYVMKKKIDNECEEMIKLIKKQHRDMHKQMETAIAKKHRKKQKQIDSLNSNLDKTNLMITEIQHILSTEKPIEFLTKIKSCNFIDSELSDNFRKSTSDLSFGKMAVGHYKSLQVY